MTWTCRTCHVTITGRRLKHCPYCHETFTRTAAGDMHRSGVHGASRGPDRRRCLTSDEMLDKGMRRNRLGHWSTGKRGEGVWNDRG